jgi:hypothetical protein
MNFSLLETLPAYVTTGLLFTAMVFMAWFGNFIARVRLKRNPEIFSDGLGSLEGALLGLVALLLAFTFSMSASRYDERRHIIVEEANVIGTAILRADLYPDSIREAFRKDFKEYVEARISYFESGIDIPKVVEAMAKGETVSKRIWDRASSLGREPKYLVQTNQMIPALNSMIDIVTTRFYVTRAKVPESILWLLFLLSLVASLVVGYGRKGSKLDWVVVAGFSLMTCLAIYLILDLDRPRRGLINMDDANARIVELREMFEE